MDENRILCPVSSVIMSSLGRLALSESLFSQPIDLVTSHTDDVAMSGSEEAFSMFLFRVPVIIHCGQARSECTEVSE